MIIKSKQKLTLFTLTLIIFAITYIETKSVHAADAPTLLTPIHSASLNDNTPTATWTAVSGALSYDLELGADSIFAVSYGIENVAGTSYTPPSPLPDGTYWWRVRTIDVIGPGSWSAARRFYIDTIPPGDSIAIFPTDGSFVNDSSPLLDWSSATGAYEYNILVDDSMTFVSPYVNTSVLSSEYQLPTLTEHQFYWKVQAVDRAGNLGNWSLTYDCTIDITPPGQIDLYSPTNGTITNDVWAYETYSDPDAVEYCFEYGSNPSFDTIYHKGINNQPIYGTDLLPDGDIYWHACAIDRAGNYGPWSETWMLTLDTVGPAAPIPTTPTNNSYITDLNPRFEWTIVEPAYRWQVKISYLENFASYIRPEIDTNYYDHNSSDLNEATVYWVVRGCDDLWNWGPWSEVMVFTVDITPPEEVTLISPTHEEVINDNTPTFNWASVEGAILYRFVLDNNDDWSSPEVSIYTENPYYEVTTALADGVYYWNVRAIDAADNIGPWGTPWSVVIDSAIVPELNPNFPYYVIISLLATPVIILKIIKRKKC